MGETPTNVDAKTEPLCRAKKMHNAHIYEPVVTRDATQRPLVDELLAFFGGRAVPLPSNLIETGRLTLQDVNEARKAFKKESKRE